MSAAKTFLRRAAFVGGAALCWLVSCTQQLPVVEDDTKPAAKLLQSFDDSVVVDRRQFTLRPFDSRWPWPLQFPAKDALIFAGEGGATFLSAASDHAATVRLEVWSSEPPMNAAGWEMHDAGKLTMDRPSVVFEGFGGKISATPMTLPGGEGTYGIRAYSKGRETAAKAELEVTDSLVVPSGLETWLIQLWKLKGHRASGIGLGA